MKTGTKDNNIWKSLFETKKVLENVNIYIDDTTTITPTEILSKCRKRKLQSGLDMIIVDYLQLMKAEQKENTSRDYNRQQEVADLTRTLKLAARELHVPIIVLSQLNRDSEKQKRMPMLSDLRESGSIEQDADIVMFISDSVEEGVVQDENDDAEDYSLIIAKHRNGERGTIPVKFKREYTLFYEKGKDTLYTQNRTKVQSDNAVLTAVEDADIDDAFGE
ncbi:MAG: DnaB-like helicase C-terminal domain-containing protein [Clostridia bacterium]|nr:DnaB-like helicase C-terminal domain-containing protein [Clostridia bacterium]